MIYPLRLLACLCIGFGGFLIVMNWRMVYVTYRTGRFHSAIPLFGAILCGAGMLLLPVTRPYAWTSVIADYGTLILLYSLPRMIREEWKTSRYNLIADYRGQRGPLSVRIRLFQRSILVMEYALRRPLGETGWTHMGNVGTWQQEGPQLTLQLGEASALFEIHEQNQSQGLRLINDFADRGAGHELSLEETDLRKQ